MKNEEEQKLAEPKGKKKLPDRPLDEREEGMAGNGEWRGDLLEGWRGGSARA